MTRAIIIGASSGIGKELAMVFAANGYEVGIAARREDLLEQIAAQLPCRCHTARLDLLEPAGAIKSLEDLIAVMGDVDIIVISAGVGHGNPSLKWEPDKATIDTNVSGFAAMAGSAMRYFMRRGHGHLAGISSIAGIRGDNGGAAYSASKAFVSNYLEGLRKKAVKEKKPVTITDILPGFVDTDMTKGDGIFWMASPQKAALQIFTAIRNKRSTVYVTRRWALIALVLKLLPDFVYNRI